LSCRSNLILTRFQPGESAVIWNSLNRFNGFPL